MICLVMKTNPKKIANLLTLTNEIFHGDLLFLCSVQISSKDLLKAQDFLKFFLDFRLWT